ncbi:(5-formylfuran-3-yl)methyl phosphate synthase [Methylophaga sp. OBS4]|uniref:(5-formylfuran-3-yl)methyl phosphate synthase n=1 Tax=Methylophaga sp. OBS4 TaxID=2991935 RepID=UPI0022586C9B|nr:(5-formylfuran-3-yl)methyl phosphate synthase [Methylophaga sp. OBS4]MCX4188315.1 (5-formylfuran-3-yl)methyl phosphate synthase [Methylophaga sp. OBS4]
MTKWLASVQSLDEAQALEFCLPDILDMKNPAQGALGALSAEEVKTVVEWVDDRCLTSATVGDLPMTATVIAPALNLMAATGVDYVKVGLFADPALVLCIEALNQTLKALKKPVIAVIFADHEINSAVLPAIKQAGFAGVMVDTAIKNGLRLTDHWSRAQLKHFVDHARGQEMFCGLAGALSIDDIERLRPLNPDYLGFRSALCDNRQRTQALQVSLAREIAQQMQYGISLAS